MQQSNEKGYLAWKSTGALLSTLHLYKAPKQKTKRDKIKCIVIEQNNKRKLDK